MSSNEGAGSGAPDAARPEVVRTDELGPEPAAAEARPRTVDAVVESLDPDRDRPRDVLCSEELTLRIAQKTILNDIDIQFPNGSITAVIGPTGTGKSIFLRTLNRMNDRISGFHREGDVTLDGTSIWSPNLDLLALRRRVGMLFQRPNPFPMSIKDNVVAGVKAHRIAKGKQLDVIAEQRLREVGLWDAVKDRQGDSPFRLSGGQQQLLCLARALAVGPDILLLDEPTSSLDPISTERVEEMLRALAPALTLIVVTHNLGQARRLSNYTMFLFEGHLAEHGPTEELFERPREQDTANYVSGRIG
jgi:phosphate transport system ATP-binding protein